MAASRATARRADGTVRCWSSIGLTLPLEGIDYGSYRIDFGHERISPADDQDSLNETFALIEELNERKLDRAIRKHQRLVAQVMNEEAAPRRRRSR